MRLPDFKTPRWRKERTWRWGTYADHVDWDEDIEPGGRGRPFHRRSSHRVLLTLRSRAPLSIGHQLDHSGRHQWWVHLRSQQQAGFTIGRSSGSSASGPTMRDVSWYDFKIEAALFGQALELRVRQPCWRESREDYLWDREVTENLWRLNRLAVERDGCEKRGYHHGVKLVATQRPYPMPERVVLRDGQPVVEHPVAYVECPHNPHALWPEDDPEGWLTKEYSGQRERRLRAEAEQRAEVARLLTTNPA